MTSKTPSMAESSRPEPGKASTSNARQETSELKDLDSSAKKQINQGESGTKKSAEPVLVRFLRLCTAVLSTPGVQESAAMMVNRISEITRVDRAVLVSLHKRQAIQAITGGGSAARDSSFADSVDIVRKQYKNQQDPMVVPAILDKDEKQNTDAAFSIYSPHLAKTQKAMGGTNILWLPLWLKNDSRIKPEYALWLERWNGAEWSRSDVDLLRHAALFFGHSLKKETAKTGNQGKFFLKMVFAFAFIALMFLPVASSVNAPMRVTPDLPHHIFAPMDGILKELYVQPGQMVDSGDVLFEYDSRVLEKRLDEARRSVGVARAKLAKMEGAALRDPQSRAELPVLKLELEQALADVDFFRGQLQRAKVRTQKPGVIVLDDPDSLIGSALKTGQAVMSVADPAKTRIKMLVPSSDIGFIREGARAEIRLDSEPLTNHQAVVTRIGFEVRTSHEGVPSVVTEALWTNAPPDVKPGQKGSAKIYGETTFLGLQILRKPLITFRTYTGI